MEFFLRGFSEQEGFRVFAFEGVGGDKKRSEFTAKADMAVIRRYGIRVQELPLLCRELLELRNEAEETHAVTFSEGDMRAHAAVCASLQEAAQRKKSFHKISPRHAPQDSSARTTSEHNSAPGISPYHDNIEGDAVSATRTR